MTILYLLQRLKMVWLTINIYISTIIVIATGEQQAECLRAVSFHETQ